MGLYLHTNHNSHHICIVLKLHAIFIFFSRSVSQSIHLAALEAGQTAALAVDVVAEGAVVAVAALLAVHAVRPGGTRVGADAALK